MKDKDCKHKRSELRRRVELAVAERLLDISDVSALSPEHPHENKLRRGKE